MNIESPLNTESNLDQYETEVIPRSKTNTQETISLEITDHNSDQTKEQIDIAQTKEDIISAIQKTTKDTMEEQEFTTSPITPSGITTGSVSSNQSFLNSLRKKIIMGTLGLIGLSASAKAAEQPSDTLHTQTKKESSMNAKKMSFVEIDKEVIHGVVLEGAITVPTSDTTREIFFLKFKGVENDKQAIQKMIIAAKKEGYILADAATLEQIAQEKSDELKKKVPYAIALGESLIERDDTYTGTNGAAPAHPVFATSTPIGINRTEKKAVENLSIGYDYAVAVYKNKHNSTTYHTLGTNK